MRQRRRGEDSALESDSANGKRENEKGKS